MSSIYCILFYPIYQSFSAWLFNTSYRLSCSYTQQLSPWSLIKVMKAHRLIWVDRDLWRSSIPASHWMQLRLLKDLFHQVWEFCNEGDITKENQSIVLGKKKKESITHFWVFKFWVFKKMKFSMHVLLVLLI